LRFLSDLPYAVTQERIAYEVCEDCARDNVIYFETRFAPALASNGKFTMEGAVVAALEGCGAVNGISTFVAG